MSLVDVVQLAPGLRLHRPVQVPWSRAAMLLRMHQLERNEKLAAAHDKAKRYLRDIGLEVCGSGVYRNCECFQEGTRCALESDGILRMEAVSAAFAFCPADTAYTNMHSGELKAIFQQAADRVDEGLIAACSNGEFIVYMVSMGFRVKRISGSTKVYFYIRPPFARSCSVKPASA